MPTFDHLKLVKRKLLEVTRYRKHLLSSCGKATELTILHERNKSCCHHEPWNKTAEALTLAINAPQTVVFVNLPLRDMTPSEEASHEEDS